MTKKVIGITGGAGSGKTEVLRIMKEDYHAQIIIADDVARKLSSPGKKSYRGSLRPLERIFSGRWKY